MNGLDSAWFVRRSCAWGCDVAPAAIGGWIVTGLFVGVLAFAGIRLEQGRGPFLVMIATIVAATFAYMAIAWWLSAPANGTSGRCGDRA